MNWKLGALLLVAFLVQEATLRQIPQNKYEVEKKGLKEFIDFLTTKTTNSKRESNFFDDRTNKDISFLTSDTEWLKKTKYTPGKKSLRLNLMDDHNIPLDHGFINGMLTPGKRCVNLLDESCSNAGVPNAEGDSFTSFKRCANLLDESCSNGYVPGTGDDSDWINGGNSPGKRSWNSVDDHNGPIIGGGSRNSHSRRCANLLDESCSNGYVPGTGDDSDWINGGNSPGKRSWNSVDDHNGPIIGGGSRNSHSRRCANLLDESCSNGYVPGTGDDSDWINGGNSPGKRSWNSVDDHNGPIIGGGSRNSHSRRCANLLDESCSNGYVPGTGDDSDWINGGNSPGKRSWNSVNDHNRSDNDDEEVTSNKRCANLLDESCNNGYVPGASDDSDWINGGNSPGKRELHSTIHEVSSGKHSKNNKGTHGNGKSYQEGNYSYQ
ncbi:uncharacterized protein LOC130893405 [Diorhabda carinulata]|uniref:uncharacterized protein LOC130893405 n=1 Tax=Diorhabda carinulata TaxID=1163345 RepID=UPI0025A10C2A|nr:uncharacterized protein LOC130893405 [Diorhabda carinulata]